MKPIWPLPVGGISRESKNRPTKISWYTVLQPGGIAPRLNSAPVIYTIYLFIYLYVTQK